MENFEAVMVAEGVEPATREEQVEAWQHLIDSGLAWSLQGWFGRYGSNLIEQGICEETVTCQKCGHVWKLYFDLNVECNNPVTEEHGKRN